MRAVRVADGVAVTAVAVVLTGLMGIPVLRAQSDRLFGKEIVGRHHDPFTVMQQFEQPLTVGVYAQPVTDVAGTLLARITGAVAAYNWLVLLSFPLAAGAAHLLARHLGLSRAGAAFVALAYAFAPFHVAHAAYHPHVAQTQWLPLYFLALFRSIDRGTGAAAALLALATVTVAGSNFYGGLIAAVLTPVALVAYRLAVPRTETWRRGLTVTLATLGFLSIAGAAYAWWAAGPVLLNRAAFAVPREDLFLHSARWWSYLVPPVAHPFAGAMAAGFWTDIGVRQGVLEQQVSLGYGVLALAAIAILASTLSRRPTSAQARIPVLVTLAAAALVCSLSPERVIGGFTFVRPSAFLYDLVPMFRSYARFGVVVQLMAVLLAGIGVDWLVRSGGRRARATCAVLLALVTLEYAVWPPALWRDVLPTSAHRWAVQQPGRMQVLDCTPRTQESATMEWLSAGRLMPSDEAGADCAAPDLAATLGIRGYTHLLVREGSDADGGVDLTAGGLRLVSRHQDADVFEVTAARPAIYTSAIAGLFPRERNPEWSWRWSESAAVWTIVNTTGSGIDAQLDVELAAFHQPRQVEILLDGRPVISLAIVPERRIYRVELTDVVPGEHRLLFRPAEAATAVNTVRATADPRALSFAVGTWTWHTTGGRP